MSEIHYDVAGAHAAAARMKAAALRIQGLRTKIASIDSAAPGLMTMDGSDSASQQIKDNYDAAAPQLAPNISQTSSNANVIAQNADTTIKNQEAVDAQAAARYRGLGS